MLNVLGHAKTNFLGHQIHFILNFNYNEIIMVLY